MSATLTIDGISKRYGDVVALDNLSFEVRPGEIFGFVGSNGAGKTTTMRIALGVLGADSGKFASAANPSTSTCVALSDTCRRNAASTPR